MILTCASAGPLRSRPPLNLSCRVLISGTTNSYWSSSMTGHLSVYVIVFGVVAKARNEAAFLSIYNGF